MIKKNIQGKRSSIIFPLQFKVNGSSEMKCPQNSTTRKHFTDHVNK